MSELEVFHRPVSRRPVSRAAAWSAPAVAAVAAAPMAAASVDSTGVAVTASQTGLLALHLLDGGGTLTATALTTVPTAFTLTNGPGPVDLAATITVTVGRPPGINIPVGRARGFGVYSLNGVPSTAGQRTATYQSAPVVGQSGFPLTTFSTTLAVSLASNGTQTVPFVLGLAGTSTGVSLADRGLPGHNRGRSRERRHADRHVHRRGPRGRRHPLTRAERPAPRGAGWSAYPHRRALGQPGYPRVRSVP